MSIIRVNDFAIRADQEDIKIDAIKSSDVYGDAGFLRPKVLQAIRRFESNIKVGNCESEKVAFSNFSLLDGVELEFISKNKAKYPYIHFGAIIVCVTPLVPNFRRLTGKVVLHDASALSFEDGFIAAYQINFEKGPAFFAFRPEHLLSVTDPFLSEAFKIAIQIDGVNFRQNREVFGVDVGCIYRLSNSARYLCSSHGDGGWSQQEIRGCQALQISDGALRDFEINSCALELDVADLDIKFRSRGPFLPSRQTRRKKFLSKPREQIVQTFPRLVKSASFHSDVSVSEEKKDVECSGRHSVHDPPSNRSVALGSTHRPRTFYFGPGCGVVENSKGADRSCEHTSGSLQEFPLREHCTSWEFGKNSMAEHRDQSSDCDCDGQRDSDLEKFQVEPVHSAPSLRDFSSI